MGLYVITIYLFLILNIYDYPLLYLHRVYWYIGGLSVDMLCESNMVLQCCSHRPYCLTRRRCWVQPPSDFISAPESSSVVVVFLCFFLFIVSCYMSTPLWARQRLHLSLLCLFYQVSSIFSFFFSLNDFSLFPVKGVAGCADCKAPSSRG